MVCVQKIDKKFFCELKKIKCLFACDVYSDYLKKRYGITPCKEHNDILFLNTLLLIYEYIAPNIKLLDKNLFRNKTFIEDWIKEMSDNKCNSNLESTMLEICDFTNLLEKINSL